MIPNFKRTFFIMITGVVLHTNTTHAAKSLDTADDSEACGGATTTREEYIIMMGGEAFLREVHGDQYDWVLNILYPKSTKKTSLHAGGDSLDQEQETALILQEDAPNAMKRALEVMRSDSFIFSKGRRAQASPVRDNDNSQNGVAIGGGKESNLRRQSVNTFFWGSRMQR